MSVVGAKPPIRDACGSVANVGKADAPIARPEGRVLRVEIWYFKQNKRSRPCTRGILLDLLAHFEHVISDASAFDQAAIPDPNHLVQP